MIAGFIMSKQTRTRDKNYYTSEIAVCSLSPRARAFVITCLTALFPFLLQPVDRASKMICYHDT